MEIAKFGLIGVIILAAVLGIDWLIAFFRNGAKKREEEENERAKKFPTPPPPKREDLKELREDPIVNPQRHTRAEASEGVWPPVYSEQVAKQIAGRMQRDAKPFAEKPTRSRILNSTRLASGWKIEDGAHYKTVGGFAIGPVEPNTYDMIDEYPWMIRSMGHVFKYNDQGINDLNDPTHGRYNLSCKIDAWAPNKKEKSIVVSNPIKSITIEDRIGTRDVPVVPVLPDISQYPILETSNDSIWPQDSAPVSDSSKDNHVHFGGGDFGGGGAGDSYGSSDSGSSWDSGSSDSGSSDSSSSSD